MVYNIFQVKRRCNLLKVFILPLL